MTSVVLMEQLTHARPKVLLLPAVLDEAIKFIKAKQEFESKNEGHRYGRLFRMNGIENLNVRNFPNLHYSAVQRKMDPGMNSTMNRYRYTQVDTSEPKSDLDKLCKLL